MSPAITYKHHADKDVHRLQLTNSGLDSMCSVSIYLCKTQGTDLNVVVVANAPQHILMSVYTICPCPHTEEAPDDQELHCRQQLDLVCTKHHLRSVYL